MRPEPAILDSYLPSIQPSSTLRFLRPTATSVPTSPRGKRGVIAHGARNDGPLKQILMFTWMKPPGMPVVMKA